MKRRVALALALGAAGCMSPEPRLYSLAPSLAADPTPFPLRVGLEPVDVAAVASRRELVLRPTPTTVELTERDLWAEPLDAMVQRVLAEDLRRALGGAAVVRLPTRLPVELDRRVVVELLDFGGHAGNRARLTAAWTIFAGPVPRPIRRGRTEVEVPSAHGSGDVSTLVTALNAAIAELARAVAEGLRSAG